MLNVSCIIPQAFAAIATCSNITRPLSKAAINPVNNKISVQDGETTLLRFTAEPCFIGTVLQIRLCKNTTILVYFPKHGMEQMHSWTRPV